MSPSMTPRGPDDYDDRDEERRWDLLFPFLSVASKGGPHEDNAFVAGVQLSRMMALLERREIAATTDMFHETLVESLDLMAMAYGYTADVLHQEDGWAHVGFTRREVHP